MALINVRLRIVGLFFNETVQIDDKPNLTVRDVLDEYIRNNPNLAVAGGLEYVRYPVGSNDYVRAFSYHYDGSFNFDGNSLDTTPPDGLTLGGVNRPSGIYTLSEDLEDDFRDTKVGLVWQYYVVGSNGNGTVKSRTPVSRGFQSVGETPTSYNISNNDAIIWRLVAIVREPNYQLA